MRPFFCSVLFLLFSCAIIAQIPNWGSKASTAVPARFKTITPVDGLPHKTVHALFQDHLGFIWMGTPLGLVKYDGYQFINYQYQPPELRDSIQSATSISVKTIAEDENGNLWIGCLYERADKPVLFCLDRRTDKLIPFLFEKGQTTAEGSILEVLPYNGRLWVMYWKNKSEGSHKKSSLILIDIPDKISDQADISFKNAFSSF